MTTFAGLLVVTMPLCGEPNTRPFPSAGQSLLLGPCPASTGFSTPSHAGPSCVALSGEGAAMSSSPRYTSPSCGIREEDVNIYLINTTSCCTAPTLFKMVFITLSSVCGAAQDGWCTGLNLAGQQSVTLTLQQDASYPA